jgi:hypothetical protein
MNTLLELDIRWPCVAKLGNRLPWRALRAAMKPIARRNPLRPRLVEAAP